MLKKYLWASNKDKTGRGLKTPDLDEYFIIFNLSE